MKQRDQLILAVVLLWLLWPRQADARPVIVSQVATGDGVYYGLQSGEIFFVGHGSADAYLVETDSAGNETFVYYGPWEV